jgi:hypothetical protein
MWRVWALYVTLLYVAYSYLNDDIKHRFYEDLETVFDDFHTYQTKSLLGDFDAKWVGKTF